MSVPKLRFKEFDGDWEKTTLGEVVKFSNGKRVPLSETDRQKRQGTYRYYGASGVIDYVDDYLFDGQYILIGEDGANIITRSSTLAFVVEGQFWVNNHAHIFQSKHGDNVFLATYLESLNYERFNSGTAQPKLNLENLKKVPVANPQKPEQTKIASFLSAVDEKINQLTQKHQLLSQYKQGMMQKLFSQQIRFKADDGSEFEGWEIQSLGNISTHIGGTALESYVDESGTYNFISIGNYSVNGKYIDNSQRIVLNQKTASKLLNKDDLVMVLNDKTASGDLIGSTILINEDNKYIYNQRSERIICNHSNVIPIYLWHFLNAEIMRSEVRKLAQGGTQIYINFGSVLSINFFLPCLEEQTKIANFLSAIDQKIDVVSEQLEQAKLWKKGLLQQMFV